ncbi:MAG TPA: hypothetical protein VMB50_04905 [Myxococcales bacterium]|nr:hypothetical protein [Myxococcales bacterium]
MKEDPIELLIVAGMLGMFALMAVAAVFFNRRARARRAAALAAGSVRTPLYGSPFNRASLGGLALVVIGSVGAGMSSKPGEGWLAALAGAVALAGLVGVITAAFRRIGTMELDSNRLTFAFGDRERAFQLDQTLAIEERFVPPSRLFPNGGAAFQLRQGPFDVLGFWVPYDMQAFRERPATPVAATAPPLRTGDLGLAVASRLRAGAPSPAARA